MERDGGRCVHCKGKVEIIHDYYNTAPYRATIDHVISQSHGGGFKMSNLALACYPCNNARGNGVIVRKKPYVSAADYEKRNSGKSVSI
jgi:5-methylcytosine-specific restriction endonuclease McrA